MYRRNYDYVTKPSITRAAWDSGFNCYMLVSKIILLLRIHLQVCLYILLDTRVYLEILDSMFYPGRLNPLFYILNKR